jgi:hypothetical protein
MMLAFGYNDAVHALLHHAASLAALLHAGLITAMGAFGSGASG